MLTSRELEQIRTVKHRISSMLSERQQRDMPGQFWDDACERFRYLLDLPEEHFALLRWHTFHVDGDLFNPYFYGHHRDRLTRMSHGLTRNIPEKYQLSAPKKLGEFGYEIDGRIVSEGLLGTQHTVNVLLKEGVMQRLESISKNEKVKILEIGAGYGGWAYHFNKLLPNSTYFIIDLPETLLLSTSYLSVCLPEKKHYIYDKDNFPTDFSKYDFVFLPNYARVLSGLNERFDLVLNIDSFQEMNAEQMEQYADFIAKNLKKEGVLYSWNKDRQLKNVSNPNVTAELKKRFKLREVSYSPAPAEFSLKKILSISPAMILDRISKRMPIGIGSRSSTTDVGNPTHEYICISKLSETR